MVKYNEDGEIVVGLLDDTRVLSKTIIINNYKDSNKLLKKINVYKSILYYNTLFVVKNNLNDEM